jgi:hypothetical protein
MRRAARWRAISLRSCARPAKSPTPTSSRRVFVGRGCNDRPLDPASLKRSLSRQGKPWPRPALPTRRYPTRAFRSRVGSDRRSAQADRLTRFHPHMRSKPSPAATDSATKGGVMPMTAASM